MTKVKSGKANSEVMVLGSRMALAVKDFDSDASKLDVLQEANTIVDAVDQFERIDLLPMQSALQALTDIALTDIQSTLGVVVAGKLLVNSDYIHPRRATTRGHFAHQSWTDAEGNLYHQIGINPYDLHNRPLSSIYATIYHEVLHFVASIAENKPLLGIPADRSDTSRQGRYHGKIFQSIVTRVSHVLTFELNKKIGCITSISEEGEKFVANNLMEFDVFKIGKIIELPKVKDRNAKVKLNCAVCGEWPIEISPSLAKRTEGLPAFDQEYAASSKLGYAVVSDHCDRPMVQVS